MLIRPAVRPDVAGILAIYNDVIATSTAVYAEQPVSLEDRLAWFEARCAAGYPVLVACIEDDVIGFSSFGDFRAWPGYRFTVEHSVHVRADQRGKGAGSAAEALQSSPPGQPPPPQQDPGASATSAAGAPAGKRPLATPWVAW